MKRAVFEIKQSPTGSYYFTFKDCDGKAHVISCSFPDRAELEKCLAAVRDAAAVAEVLEYDSNRARLPCFLIQTKADGVAFSMIGFLGEIIFSSVLYGDEKSCTQAIGIFKALSKKAAVIDLTEE